MGHRELDVASFRAWLARARTEISRSRQRLNAENLYPVADADTGSNMEATIRAAADAVEHERSTELHVVAEAAATGALHGAQGNSGVLLSQILRGFADGLHENLPKAFALAHERALKAVADPKEGTILSVARAAKDAAANVTQWGSGIRRDGEVALAAWKAARASTLESATNPPSEAARGTIDAGAHGIELIYRSLVAVLDSDSQDLQDLPENVRASAGTANQTRKSDGAFEVMYDLANISESDIERLRANLAGIGESLLVVGDMKFWKVHIHTDLVEESIAFAKEIGSPDNIRITALEVDSCTSERTLITVANGSGFAELMRDSGVTVIEALNSRRVTPEEWVQSAASAQEAILIPHDSHGHTSAGIAANLLERAGTRVRVINSTSPLQALAAISTHSENIEADFASEVARMESAAQQTTSITIAFAPREMRAGLESVAKGSAIALKEGVIIVFGSDVIEVALKAILGTVTEASELITLVTGADVVEDLATKLAAHITELIPSIEVTTYSGGQAWYPLLIGIE
jgi:DAK2 domain fusion protein YloV